MLNRCYCLPLTTATTVASRWQILKTTTKYRRLAMSTGLEIRRVINTGQNEDFNDLQRIVKNDASYYYSDANDLLGKVVNESERYKCRLLLDNKQAVGAVFYEGRTTRRYEDDGLKDSVRINILYSQSQDARRLDEYYGALLNQVNLIARDLNGKSLSIKVKSAQNVHNFLLSQGFKQIWEKGSVVFMGKDLEESKKRKHGESDQPLAKTRVVEKAPDPNPHQERPPLIRNASDPGFRNLPRNQPPLIRDPEEARIRRRSLPGQSQAPRLTSTTIQRKYLNYIASGHKTVEGRINTGMFERCKVGENIQFFNGTEKVLCRITEINKYSSFDDMLRTEGYANCLPDVRSLQDACRIYQSIKGYPERARQHGVLAIHVKRI